MGTYDDRNGAASLLEAAEVVEMQERLAALEFALESLDWRLLSAQADQEFSRVGLRDITEFSRIMALKNPLIKRSVAVQRLYVFGQGFNVRAETPELDEALTTFYDDVRNVAELSQQEMASKEVELQVSGNLFFALFVNRLNGRVRLRSIPFEEIEEVICDPDDGKTPWFYRRLWVEHHIDMFSGATSQESMQAFYPDWRYDPISKPPAIGSTPIKWETSICHVKVNGFSHWRFGLSEVYASIDWAKAYKEFLEDWASIVRAYRKFAFQLTQPGGKSAVMAAKARLETGAPVSNPAPAAGSTFIAGEGVKLEAVRTNGATVSAEDGRRLLLMVAASAGLPETFYGDASIGTLATAKSLDRPTELQMRDRQNLWVDVLNAIHDFVLLWQVKAPQGTLRGLGTIERTVEDKQNFERVLWNEDVSPRVAVEFPPLVQSDTPSMVGAMVDAATLRGQALAGTVDLPTLAGMLLSTLGVQDVDQVLDRLFPDGEAPEPSETSASEAAMVEAVRELRGAIAALNG